MARAGVVDRKTAGRYIEVVKRAVELAARARSTVLRSMRVAVRLGAYFR